MFTTDFPRPVRVSRRLAAGLAAALTATLGLSACTPAGSSDDQITVVVGLYPFQYVAEQIAGDRATVTNLTVPGAEPHDLELTPQQVGAVAEADLVIYLAGLQPAVDEAVDQGQPAHALNVSTVVDLLTLADESTAPQDPDETVGHDDHDHAAGLGDHDPHVWLDPIRMPTIAQAVADQLIGLDPDGTAFYQAQTETLESQFADLDQNYRDGLSSCQRQTFVTSHAAFGYLAARYDLTQVPIAGLSPDAEPSPSRIAEIHRLIDQYDVTTIFFETLASPAMAETIADDLGLTTAVLDPIEGLSDQSQADDYPGLMAANLAALRLANGCA
ncbi:MAG: metal ABC transporter substrate-binding protein [Propionibacteriaceae bacterium]|nr:metal ABC transporter substrate-binding protein [Propionibacteriaceae bacterium]